MLAFEVWAYMYFLLEGWAGILCYPRSDLLNYDECDPDTLLVTTMSVAEKELRIIDPEGKGTYSDHVHTYMYVGFIPSHSPRLALFL